VGLFSGLRASTSQKSASRTLAKGRSGSKGRCGINLLEARFSIVSGFADNPPIWTVPSGGSTLDLIGAPGSNRDFCSALSCVF
jgi:hypothetical protein